MINPARLSSILQSSWERELHMFLELILCILVGFRIGSPVFMYLVRYLKSPCQVRKVVSIPSSLLDYSRSFLVNLRQGLMNCLDCLLIWLQRALFDVTRKLTAILLIGLRWSRHFSYIVTIFLSLPFFLILIKVSHFEKKVGVINFY